MHLTPPPLFFSRAMCECVCARASRKICSKERQRKRDKGREGAKRQRGAVCRIGALDIQTDSIHLSPPGGASGRPSLLAEMPVAKHIWSLFCIQRAYLCINTSHFVLHGWMRFPLKLNWRSNELLYSKGIRNLLPKYSLASVSSLKDASAYLIGRFNCAEWRRTDCISADK